MRQPTVLIISANPPQIAALRACLQSGGYGVVEAAGSAAVPGMLDRMRPALVLLDWDLPHLSPLAMIRAIRSQPDFARLPVVLLAKDISCENKILSLEAGADYCLDGIMHPNEFLARVRALIRRASG